MKGWVEIRSSPSPLRPHVSTAMLTVKPKRAPIEDFWGVVIGYDQPRPRVYKITSKVWLGGQVVGRVKASMFRSRAGFQLGNGKCEKISKTLVKRLLAKKED